MSFEFTDPLCACNEEVYTFLQDVFDEVMDIFPSPYIHLGGDEAKKTPWERSPACQSFMKAHNLEDVGQLQSYFITRVGGYIQSKGRQVIGWDEILEGGMGSQALIMCWRGDERTHEAINNGNRTIVANSHQLYLDHRQDPGTGRANYQSGINTLEDVYTYNPIPEGLSTTQQALVLGSQVCLWTEYVYTEADAEVRLLPRLLAQAEVSWSQERDSFPAFENRAWSQLGQLEKQGYRYFVAPPRGPRMVSLWAEPVSVVLSHPRTDMVLRYTLDGSTPTAASLLYEKPLKLEQEALIKAVAFASPDNQSEVIEVRVTPPLQASSTSEKDLVPGLRMTLYHGQINRLRDFGQMKALRTETVPSVALPAQRPNDNFGLIFEGYLKLDEAGDYTWVLSSDDGSQLWLADELVVDHDGRHGMGPLSAQRGAQAGLLPIRIMYFESAFSEGLELQLVDAAGKELNLGGRFFSAPAVAKP
ncbi:MAG: family 20 glycosylhydrolase [Cytophagales bacterium]|nr:family 20 glycosylhydrolase [Cytophagales bacterium]